MSASEALRPARVCGALLAALLAAEGRSRNRKRDQMPDHVGFAVKRRLLEQVLRDDPGPQAFEQWLLDYAFAAESIPGTTLAIARSVLEEWRLARQMPEFAAWLASGAPSADADIDSSTKAQRLRNAEGGVRSAAEAAQPRDGAEQVRSQRLPAV